MSVFLLSVIPAFSFIPYLYIQIESELHKTLLDAQHEPSLIKTMQKHLEAVSERDLETLKSTLSPDNELIFILPNRELTTHTEDFIDYHKEWFKDQSWTIETEIIDTKTGEKLGIAITEIIYREPDRDGQPYYNRMIISYALKNIEGNWYVFKDHASSVETSLN